MSDERRDSAIDELNQISAVVNRTYRSVEPRVPLLLAVWGGVHFLGLGAIALDLRLRDGMPVLGLSTLVILALVGFAVTYLEVRRSLHGVVGRAARDVQQVLIVWAGTCVAWVASLMAYVVSREEVQNEALAAVAAALAVVFLGAWYLATLAQHHAPAFVGLGLVAFSACALVLPDPSTAVLVVCLGSSASLLLGAVQAQRQRQRRSRLLVAADG